MDIRILTDKDRADLDNHIGHQIHQGEVHGMKFNDKGKLEVYNGKEWIELKGGGLPVNITRNIEVTKEDDRRIELQWQDPEDVKIDGKTVAKWKSTKIVRKQGSKPKNDEDGVLVGQSSVRNQYKDKPFVDTQGLENDVEYYYGIFPESEDEIVTVSNECIIKATPTEIHDTTNSPGNKTLIAGTMKQGFFGEVPASEFIRGDELCSRLGITEGENQFSNEPWLKFALDGKILFRPKKAIRYKISWSHLNDKNCIYGDRTIEIDGVKYKVRLMKGALTDPSKYNASDKGAKGSEWNRLMLPISIKAKDKSWEYPEYVEDDIPYWGIDYTDSDLQVGSGDGRWVWCQEKTNESGNYRVYRGGACVSYSYSDDPSRSNSNRGFAPVLEVVE